MDENENMDPIEKMGRDLMHRLYVASSGKTPLPIKEKTYRELYTEYRDGTLDPYLNRLNKENEAAYDQIIHTFTGIVQMFDGVARPEEEVVLREQMAVVARDWADKLMMADDPNTPNKVAMEILTTIARDYCSGEYDAFLEFLEVYNPPGVAESQREIFQNIVDRVARGKF
jgi:hypothetical protein